MNVKRDFIVNLMQPSLDELKSNLRMTSNVLDGEILRLLKVAILGAEHEIGQIISRSTFVIKTKFQSSIQLKTNAYKINSVYLDSVLIDEEQYSFDEDDYTLTFDEKLTGKNLRITYEAGLEYVPEDMKQAIILAATYFYENPTDTIRTLPSQSEKLLRPYRTWGGM